MGRQQIAYVHRCIHLVFPVQSGRFPVHLDPATKRPVGTPFDVAHFHGARHKLREVSFGPGVAADKLVFTMSDSTGNIWMTKIEPPR